MQGASVLFRCWRCGLLLLLLISICVCTHDMMLSLLLLALGIAGAADALPETSNYNAGVTSNDDWDSFQVVALSFSSADVIDGVLGRANITDVWRVDHGSRTAHVVVSADEARRLRRTPGVSSLAVAIADLGAATKATQPGPDAKKWTARRPMAEFFEEWRNLEEIEAFSEVLCLLHPARCTFTPSIGTSAEGRDIFALQVGGQPGGPAVYHQALLHAREWIVASTVLYIMMELLESDDPAVISLLDDLKHVFVPMANPDGYHWSWGPAEDRPGNRMWRKNRNPNDGSSCIGTDLNRNWEDGHWSGPGASSNPCSDTYHGPGPMSEPETRSIERLLMDDPTSTLVGAIDWHSFGKLILTPYGWTATTLPPNDAEVRAVGNGMAQAILESPTEEVYRVGGAAELLGVACGGCDDWLYTNATDEGFAYTFESRPRSGGFVLPASEIIPTGVESYAATVWFGQEMLRRHNDNVDVKPAAAL